MITNWDIKKLVCFNMSFYDLQLLLSLINSSVPSDMNVDRTIRIYNEIKDKLDVMKNSVNDE